MKFKPAHAKAIIFVLAVVAGWFITKSVVVAYCNIPSVSCTVAPTPTLYGSPTASAPVSWLTPGVWDVVGVGLGFVLGIVLVMIV